MEGEMPAEHNDSEMLDDETVTTETANKQDEVDTSKDDEKERVSYKTRAAELEAELEATRKALHERNKENQKRREQNKTWEDLGVDPDTVKEWMSEKEKAEMKKAEEKGEWEKIKQKILEESDAKLRKKDEEVLNMQKSLETILVDSKINEAILKNDGVPELLKDVIKAKTKLVNEDGVYRTVVLDDDGSARVNDRGDYLSIDDIVPELKEHPIYGMAFKAPTTKGMGTSSTAAGNKTNNVKTAPKKPRSEMTMKDKEAFITEYGIAEYNKLPMK
jgi:hypothetical protein